MNICGQGLPGFHPCGAIRQATDMSQDSQFIAWNVELYRTTFAQHSERAECTKTVSLGLLQASDGSEASLACNYLLQRVSTFQFRWCDDNARGLSRCDSCIAAVFSDVSKARRAGNLTQRLSSRSTTFAKDQRVSSSKHQNTARSLLRQLSPLTLSQMPVVNCVVASTLEDSWIVQ